MTSSVAAAAFCIRLLDPPGLGSEEGPGRGGGVRSGAKILVNWTFGLGAVGGGIGDGASGGDGIGEGSLSGDLVWFTDVSVEIVTVVIGVAADQSSRSSASLSPLSSSSELDEEVELRAFSSSSSELDELDDELELRAGSESDFKRRFLLHGRVGDSDLCRF